MNDFSEGGTMSEAVEVLVEENTAGGTMSEALPPSTSIIETISRAATDPNVSVDKMERLIAMQLKLMDRQAAEAFAQAMSTTQAEIQPVLKTAYNDQTRSNYETEEAINREVTPIYTKHGFSLSFDTKPSGHENHIVVVCNVLHSCGHSKLYSYDLPYDIAGIKGSVNKTAIHASGSTLTYGRRYLTKLIFNIATTDDDGQAATMEAEVETISDATIDAILQGMDISGKSQEKCLKYINQVSSTTHERLTQLTEKEGQRVVRKLHKAVDEEMQQ